MIGPSQQRLFNSIYIINFYINPTGPLFLSCFICVCFYKKPSGPKVPCAVAIRTAKAVAEEVPEVSKSSLGRLAEMGEKNSERDVHRLTKKFKLTLPVQMSTFKVGREQIHYIKMTAWAQFLLSRNLWHHLAGLDSPDMDKCQQTWTLFWERFKKMRPSHEVFGRPGFDFSRCCGLLLHGDEGRGLRKSAVLVLAAHSILGYGIRTSRKSNKDDVHKLNYLKSTWVTRFLLGILPKSMYSMDENAGQDDECDDGGFQSDVYEGLLNVVAKDLRHLFEHGIVNPLDGQRYFFCIVNVMGDWPFIQRAGHLARSFYNAAKHARASQTTIPKGICHRCLADRPGCVWEDFESIPPPWEPSMNTESPFITEPCLLQLPHMRNDPAELFSWDLFHTWHIGCGKTFLGTAIIVLATSCIFAGGVDKRLELLTERFQIWRDRMRLKPHIRKLSKENLSWPTTTSYPSGVWSKGHTTRVLNKWFIAECNAYAEEVRSDRLLTIAYRCSVSIEKILKGLCSYELWIPSAAALEIADYGLNFLMWYGRGAREAFQNSRRLFFMMPNLHRLHHIAWDLKDAAKKLDFVPNPLAWSTQPSEDYIGRPSRISRRVSPRLQVLRTLQRSLIAARAAYRNMGLILDWDI